MTVKEILVSLNITRGKINDLQKKEKEEELEKLKQKRNALNELLRTCEVEIEIPTSIENLIIH